MKKVFRMKNLDCANCAAKMERLIRKLDGVVDAEVNFMAQKLVLEADDTRFQEIIEQAKACVKRVEPDCEILA